MRCTKAEQARTRAALRLRVADLLDHIAKETGDGRYRRAAGHVLGGKGGRPPVDDAAALRLAQALCADGTSKRAAALTVARIYSAAGNVTAMAERIRKKLGRK